MENYKILFCWPFWRYLDWKVVNEDYSTVKKSLFNRKSREQQLATVQIDDVDNEWILFIFHSNADYFTRYNKIYIQFSSFWMNDSRVCVCLLKYSHTTNRENSAIETCDEWGSLWTVKALSGCRNEHQNIFISCIPDRIVSPREFWILIEHGSVSTIKYFLRI